MILTIAKVDEILFEGDAYSVTLPTAAGEVTVLSEHMPLATTLVPGTVRVRRERDSSYEEFAVTSGVLEVTPEGATILL
jgi:F-type H+-transporting ATPase subunit epsilon